ncbi:carbohydrate ABC transporter permease [Jeotgalibaca porci]|uniref:carbohydrate ABC transporter permease n=1 Tax=Jeotgalibaca porci TaxID=1868793 RepID=UPI0035A03C22
MKKKIERFRHMDTFDKVTNVIVFIGALLFMMPLLWLLSNTFKYSAEIYRIPPTIIPDRFTLSTLTEVFQGQRTFRWIFNSFIVSFGTAFLSVIISALAAYGFAKLKIKGGKALFIIIISSIMIPKETFIVPLFEIIVDLNWVDTYASMIIPNLATGFGTFMLYSFFASIPDSVRESAKIDGAGEWLIFRKLMLPIVKPGLAALFILNFVTTWNDYLWQLLMARTEEMQTLNVGVASLQQSLNPNIGLKVAGAFIAAVPMIIVFVAFQKYFIAGATDGAVKE